MTGRRTLVLGGARSGKSAFAESLLEAQPRVVYVATATADAGDAEWTERIARHRARRPAHWQTAETADLAGVLAAAGDPALVDSVTTWLAGAMDATGVWDATPYADKSLAEQVDALVHAWTAAARDAVAVSDEVGGGIVPDSPSARRFRDELGLLNQRLAAAADDVWLVTAGIPLRLR